MVGGGARVDLRGHLLSVVLLSSGTGFREDRRNYLYIETVLLLRMQNSTYVFKTEHKISRVVDCFRFCAWVPSPHIFILFCFRVMLVEKFEKQVLDTSSAPTLDTLLILTCPLFKVYSLEWTKRKDHLMNVIVWKALTLFLTGTKESHAVLSPAVKDLLSTWDFLWLMIRCFGGQMWKKISSDFVLWIPQVQGNLK